MQRRPNQTLSAINMTLEERIAELENKIAELSKDPLVFSEPQLTPEQLLYFRRLLDQYVPAASPGGTDTQIQFNDNGSFGGDANFTWDKTSGGGLSVIAPNNTMGGDGGYITLLCGNGNNTRNGGDVDIIAGDGGISGNGGNVILIGGLKGASGTNNGAILLQSAYVTTAQTYSPSAGGTATLDLALSNEHRITMPAGNITIDLSSPQNSQKFMISITQDSGGSRTVTWFTTIKWAGGNAPTLTTTANKRDTFGFVRTGSGTYDGFIIGLNV